MCFKKEVHIKMVKNTLLAKAIEKVEDKDFGEIPTVLKGSTSLMISETGNVPAKLIKEFRKKEEKPLLKAAYIDESVYIGDDQLEMLAALKSKDELIADVVSILQSPAKTVISQLQSGKDKLSGVVKALADREE
jgi:large subunit ribosomal protein L10